METLFVGPSRRGHIIRSFVDMYSSSTLISITNCVGSTDGPTPSITTRDLSPPAAGLMKIDYRLNLQRKPL